MPSEVFDLVKKKKRKRMQSERKFLVGSRVEVRSLEDGLLGSWHSGTVVACFPQSRLVRYDSCLANDGSGQVEENVPVRYGGSSSCRALIRPLPYPVAFRPEELLYGLCVDVRHKDAWWEGVIFDHNTGAEERDVFFPDIGDELVASIDNIRISCDWIESESNWLRRGFWSFLKVIGDLEDQFHLPVSVKQIWYDLRQMEGFEKIEDWTYTNEAVWGKLVFDTILENLIISQSCISPPSESLGELANMQSAELEPSEPQPPSDLDMITATGGSGCLSILPVNEPSDACLTYSDIQPSKISTDALALLPGEELGEFVPVVEYNEPKIHIPVKPDAFSTNGTPVPKSGRWEPVDLDPEPEYCPEAFKSYLVNRDSKSLRSIITAVRKHMAHLGWKAETTFSGGTTRHRYISPDGNCYQSLREVCRAQRRNAEIIPAPCSELANRSLVTLPGGSISSPLTTARNAIVCRDSVSSEAMIDDDCDQTPAHCPRAILDYYALKSDQCRKGSAKKLRSRVRQELEAIGWKFIYRQKEQKREMVYISPRQRHYFSLRMACKGCIEDCRTAELIWGTMDRVNVGEEVVVKPSLSVGRGSSQKALVSVKTENVESDGKLRNFNRDSTHHLKLKIKLPRSLVKANNEKKMSRLKHAARSSKRVLNILPGQCSHNPRTVLSWLVDEDIFLPRAKVYCRGDNSRSRRKEGRVQRDGIKCCCCNEVLTVSGFASHSGGKNGSPAAMIFLEDGRSLLDCQVQILKKRNYLKEDSGDSVIQKAYADESHENDHLCSICHYGGDLILCDQCPSSFHKTCLGLKDVPDGEWFCPSCCCGLCGEGNLREDTEQFPDGNLLNCNQCERKYHIACLRGKGEAELEDQQRGNWYCSRKCKQIHGGLLELEGKKISLGKDNLTLTLLKPEDYKRRDDVDSNMGPAAENFVKLSIALAVMHECFESVKEPHSDRDIIEDVIFNRGSGLNRLNFHGFYTALLEENDELITVATLRLHGEEVTEIPLVATRFLFRRRGMCRALMDALEKKLKELGVKRIVLPAAPSALNTWSGSFGFTEMTESERLQFVNHTFLNFQDTIMCQKHLFDSPSVESTVSTSGNLLLKFSDHPKGSPDTELQDSCTVSEEFQGKAMEGNEIVEQGTVDGVKDAGGFGNSIHEVSQPGRKQSFSDHFLESSITNIHSDEQVSRENSGIFLKYYKRRRLSTQNG